MGTKVAPDTIAKDALTCQLSPVLAIFLPQVHTYSSKNSQVMKNLKVKVFILQIVIRVVCVIFIIVSWHG